MNKGHTKSLQLLQKYHESFHLQLTEMSKDAILIFDSHLL